MATHEPKSCPRCQQAFECKPGNITECQCFGLQFTAGEREFIGAESGDCLCRDCLIALQQEYRYRETKARLVQMQEIMRGRWSGG